MGHLQRLRSRSTYFSRTRRHTMMLFAGLSSVALLFAHSATTSDASTTFADVLSERANPRVTMRKNGVQKAITPQPLAAPFASVMVDRTDDDASASACSAAPSDCSLRGSIAFANLNPGTTISVPAGTYNLSIPGGAVEGFNGDNSIGDLDITASNTTLVGSGADTTIINQTQPNDRVIEVNPFLDAGFITGISDVTISGGRETTAVGGGGIISGSIDNSLTLSNCVISGNSASGTGTFGGGGVSHSGGNLTINSCSFANNSTTGSGGAIGYSAGDPLGRTPSLGVLSVSGSSFSSNSAGSVSAGGGALDLFNFNSGNGSYTINTSSFTNNIATSGRGGAIVVESGPLTISYSRLVGNTAALPANGHAIFAGASVDANNNWWGVNSGPSADDITGPAETQTTVWLQLRHTANPTTICTGASSTLTADIRDRNEGDDLTVELNGLPEFAALFVQGTPALGSVTGTTNFVDGVATALFTAGAATGTATIDVTADNETQNASIEVQSNTTSDPGDLVVCEGATAIFTTTTAGPGPVTYVWKQGATVISDGDLGGRASIVSSDTTSTLTITNVETADANTYTVEATGECNADSQSATLTVNTTPVVTLDPVSQTITPGDSVTFTAAATGSPTPTVQWQVSTDGGLNFADIPGETNTSLTFTVQQSHDGNQYRAVFTNECGSDTSAAATLTTCKPASVTQNPTSVVDVCVGTLVNFTAAASGFPTPTVQWQISTDGGVSFTDIPGATSTTLGVTATVALRDSQYRAVFTNDCGTDTTAAATLGVDTIAPVITLNSNTIILRPPNHNYYTVNVTDLVAAASDNCTSDLLSSVVIGSVSSDEPENGDGDGDTLNDIVIAADCKSVQLRAERQNAGNGRVYRINFQVTDTAGNVTTVTANVYVPVSQTGAMAIDDGPGGGYTVNGTCP